MWTAGERKYLKAIMAWQEKLDEQSQDTAAPELRVLMIGSKNVGKTSLLRRFCTDSFDATAQPDPQFARGGRRTLRLPSGAYAMDILEVPSPYVAALCTPSSPAPDGAASATAPVDRAAALGAPLTRSTPAAVVLAQAVALTQAAIIVYDVTDAASLAQACMLYSRILLESRRGVVDDETAGVADAAETETETDGEAAAAASAAGAAATRSPPRRLPLRKLFRKNSKEDKAPVTEGEAAVLADQAPAPAPAPPPPSSPPCYSIVLVGNKSDVADDARAVTWHDGRQAAAAIVGAAAAAAAAATSVSPTPALPTAGFLETSAKTGARVGDLFLHTGRAILRQQRDTATASADTTTTTDTVAGPPATDSAVSPSSTASTETASKSPVLRTQPHRASAGSQASRKAAAPGPGRVFRRTFRRKSATA